MLGGGMLVSMLQSRPEVAAVMAYLASPDAVRPFVEVGGYYSPHSEVPVEWYPDYINQKIAAILAETTDFRFDASDMMPGEVGGPAFWEGMVAMLEGENIYDVLARIDSQWPQE